MSPGRKALGLRARLTLWYGGVLLVVLLLFSALSYAALRWTLLRDVDSTLLVVAQVVRDTGYPRGPLEWGDAIGPDRVLAVLRGLRETYGEERYRPAPVLAHAVRDGVALRGRTAAP